MVICNYVCKDCPETGLFSCLVLRTVLYLLKQGVIFINIFTMEYDGVLSSDFGLYLATLDSSSLEVESGVDTEVISSEMQRYEGKLIYGVKQSGEFEFPLTLISDTVISVERMGQIKDWLFHHNKPCKFRFIGEGYSDWFYYAFINYDSDYIDSKGLRGIKFKVKSISPYAYGDMRSYKFDISPNTDHGFTNYVKLTIPNVETANVYGVKPIITITSTVSQDGDDSNFNKQKEVNGGRAVFNIITNVTTNESIWYTVQNIEDYGTTSSPTIITIDCHKGIITAKSGETELDYYPSFQDGIRVAAINNTLSTFPSLLKGDNILKIYGFIQSIKIEYIPSIRLGAW